MTHLWNNEFPWVLGPGPSPIMGYGSKNQQPRQPWLENQKNLGGPKKFWGIYEDLDLLQDILPL